MREDSQATHSPFCDHSKASAIVLESRIFETQSRRWEWFEFDPLSVDVGDEVFWIVREDSGGLSLRGFFYGSFLPGVEDHTLRVNLGS